MADDTYGEIILPQDASKTREIVYSFLGDIDFIKVRVGERTVEIIKKNHADEPDAEGLSLRISLNDFKIILDLVPGLIEMLEKIKRFG